MPEGDILSSLPHALRIRGKPIMICESGKELEREAEAGRG